MAEKSSEHRREKPTLLGTKVRPDGAIFNKFGLFVFSTPLAQPGSFKTSRGEITVPEGTMVGHLHFLPFDSLKKTGTGAGAIRKGIRALTAFFKDIEELERVGMTDKIPILLTGQTKEDSMKTFAENLGFFVERDDNGYVVTIETSALKKSFDSMKQRLGL